MTAIYRFTTQGTCARCGKRGQIRGGVIYGQYTLLDAMLWALEDLFEGEREPLLVACDGEVLFDAAKVRIEAGIPEGDPDGECTCLGSPKRKSNNGE